jgi:hypothetical protein
MLAELTTENSIGRAAGGFMHAFLVTNRELMVAYDAAQILKYTQVHLFIFATNSRLSTRIWQPWLCDDTVREASEYLIGFSLLV